jgi:hypothetical protein
MNGINYWDKPEHPIEHPANAIMQMFIEAAEALDKRPHFQGQIYFLPNNHPLRVFDDRPLNVFVEEQGNKTKLIAFGMAFSIVVAHDKVSVHMHEMGFKCTRIFKKDSLNARQILRDMEEAIAEARQATQKFQQNFWGSDYFSATFDDMVIDVSNPKIAEITICVSNGYKPLVERVAMSDVNSLDIKDLYNQIYH